VNKQNVTRKQAADLLGVCTKTIDRIRRSGVLPFRRSHETGAVTVDRADLERVRRAG
jgi:hypothetical protein